MHSRNSARALMRLFAALALACLALPALANPMGGHEFTVDRPGSDFHSFQAGDAGICATSCATNDNCMAYTYVKATGTCWMKDKIPPRKASSCCISGVRVMGPAEIGIDRPGNDLKPGFATTTFSQCESACRNEKDCKSYTWVKPGLQAQTGMCWLKRGRMRKQDNDCCVSGVRLRDPARRNLGQPGSLSN